MNEFTRKLSAIEIVGGLFFAIIIIAWLASVNNGSGKDDIKLQAIENVKASLKSNLSIFAESEWQQDQNGWVIINDINENEPQMSLRISDTAIEINSMGSSMPLMIGVVTDCLKLAYMSYKEEAKDEINEFMDEFIGGKNPHQLTISGTTFYISNADIPMGEGVVNTFTCGVKR